MARFTNVEPSRTIVMDGERSLLSDLIKRRNVGRPVGPVPLVVPQFPSIAADLAVTWFGHASALIEIAGHRVLADPVWSRRVSPVQFVGPSRLHEVPIGLDELPHIDAVIISHDHYDHLDKNTIIGLSHHTDAVFLVPTAVARYLRGWGISPSRVIELAWNESAEVGSLTLHCVAARHFSGRGLIRNTTLWASWVISGNGKSVYFGGDTGYTAHFSENADRYGPFDLTLLPIGAYDSRWPDIHLNPEQAVQAHLDLAGGGAAASATFVPIHWATFNLAFHAWVEPVQRLIAAAGKSRVPLSLPKPGQRLDLTHVSVDAETDVKAQWWSEI